MSARPSEHPAWPELTDRQRAAINEVWDALVVPALEENERLRQEVAELSSQLGRGPVSR